jgi:hypothetical protein
MLSHDAAVVRFPDSVDDRKYLRSGRSPSSLRIQPDAGRLALEKRLATVPLWQEYALTFPYQLAARFEIHS